MGSLLELKNIEKSFPLPQKERLLILDNLNFSLNAGESVSIQGKSGSGKSTLLSIAALLDLPTSGQVLYHGKSCEGLNDKELSKLRQNSMGFVFQNSFLLEDFSALENVAIPLMIKGIGKKRAKEEAEILLSELGLENRLHHRPKELSGGERQRVAIARALIGNGDIIFADEPTGALDEENAFMVEQMLLKVAKEKGKALLLVTHNPNFATLCDKSYLLENKHLRLLSERV